MENGSKRNTRGCVVMSGAITSNYRENILTVITREYSAKRHGAKILARHAKASYRTAQAWISGRNVPSGQHFMNLLQECEAMADIIKKGSVDG